MRPCRFAKGNQSVCIGTGRVVKAIGCANQETYFAHTIVTPAFKEARQFDRAKLLALFIHHDGFVRAVRRGNIPAAIRQFAVPCWPANPFQIAIDQFRFGGAANLAARDDMQAHRHRRRRPVLLRHDFGRVTKCPHAFQIVEAADFGTEKMHDDIFGINQHPVRRWQTFDAGMTSGLFDTLGKLLRH